MSYLKTAEIFLKKHGIRGLEKIRTMCNKGYPLKDIAETFNVSIPTAGRLRESLFKCVYIVSEEVKEHLEYEKKRHHWASTEYEGIIKKTDEIECKILNFSQNKEVSNVQS